MLEYRRTPRLRTKPGHCPTAVALLAGMGVRMALAAAITLPAATVALATWSAPIAAPQASVPQIARFDCGSIRSSLPDGDPVLHTPRPTGVAGLAVRATGTTADVRHSAFGSVDELHRALAAGHFRSGSGVRVQCVGASGSARQSASASTGAGAGAGASERASERALANAPRDTAYAVTWQLRLEQLEYVSSLNGDRSLTAFEQRYSVDDPGDARRTTGSSVAEVITLPGAEHWHVAEDGSTLRASRSLRRAGAGCATITLRCSTDNLIDWRLAGTAQHVELVQTRYVNGVASDAVLWRLER